jgi:hypothetical protein
MEENGSKTKKNFLIFNTVQLVRVKSKILYSLKSCKLIFDLTLHLKDAI